MRRIALECLQKFTAAGDALVGASGRWPGREIEAAAKLAAECIYPDRRTIMVAAVRSLCALAIEELERGF